MNITKQLLKRFIQVKCVLRSNINTKEALRKLFLNGKLTALHRVSLKYRPLLLERILRIKIRRKFILHLNIEFPENGK